MFFYENREVSQKRVLNESICKNKNLKKKKIPDKYKYWASRGLNSTTRFFPVTCIRKLSITWKAVRTYE